MRKLQLEIDWYRPSEITDLRAWLHWSWRSEIGERRYDGFRILGLQIELSWMWMTDEEYEEWEDLRRDKAEDEAFPFSQAMLSDMEEADEFSAFDEEGDW